MIYLYDLFIYYIINKNYEFEGVSFGDRALKVKSLHDNSYPTTCRSEGSVQLIPIPRLTSVKDDDDVKF